MLLPETTKKLDKISETVVVMSVVIRKELAMSCSESDSNYTGLQDDFIPIGTANWQGGLLQGGSQPAGQGDTHSSKKKAERFVLKITSPLLNGVHKSSPKRVWDLWIFHFGGSTEIQDPGSDPDPYPEDTRHHWEVKTRIFTHSPHGHPDQIPYIITWEDLASNPPPWVAPFSPPKLPLRSPLEPSAPLIPLPPPQTSHLYPVLNKSETLVKTGTRPKKVLPPEDSALIDLLTDEPPPYQPQPLQAPEPDHPSSEDENQEGPTASAPPDPSPMVGWLRGRRDHTASGDTSRVLPLRHTGGPNGQYQYWPFSASDLYNWKTHNPSFTKDPIALTSLIESILVTHQPTWDDCQQLLQILLTSEEKQKVLLEARKNVPGDDRRPTQLPNLINEAFPLIWPNWDYTTEAGRDHLRLYRQLLIAGLHAAGRRPTNLAQVRQTTQRAEETPTAFLGRLKEAYRRFTPFDPDSEDQKGNVSMAFIWQSAPDIRTKLQRLDNLQDFSLADLLKEAEKIYNKRETPEE
ncbi:uncharacterized protein LOC124094639 [Marmota monax]|uniref:uncharacterized protein LOC124094639 n=1 Tax=Marmota monax TaxID=9995 RepID=UPI001EAFB3B5|nr:uncharacterized protein LOC124094639 [Marmota monax]